ncbi:hypothetical protein QQS21_002415 [Conoideocrella luteorostrata]|uniref:Uncharacterized protein n=1 Tax=Conoideocrella luteorostrata TaxID=1105319 RepID=A0AAJ0CVA1_9HYPO|nr:hypothetical protein QQS21_002415 [Conoideocrella luteorostrata]
MNQLHESFSDTKGIEKKQEYNQQIVAMEGDEQYNPEDRGYQPNSSTSSDEFQPNGDREGKGKGVETSTENKSLNHHASVLDRVQSSGRALFSSTITDKGVSEYCSGQKGSGLPNSSASSAAHKLIYDSRPKLNGNSPAMPRETLRSTGELQRSDADFDAFSEQNSSTDVIHNGTALYEPGEPTDVGGYKSLDGLDVVELLSRPDQCESPMIPEPNELTPFEAARLREAMFASGSAWPFWDQLLNFNPDFMAKPEISGTDFQAHLGTQDPEEARGIWLRQWNDVLSSYTDEVWGDLSPLATMARQEIRQWTDDGASRNPNTKALGRLRLVLAHVRGY